MVAYTNLNLKPKEFWNEMNPRSFVKMCEGFNLRYRREQAQRIEEMRLNRWIGYLIYNTNVTKGNRKEPDKLYPLPQLDTEVKERKIPTKEEIEEIKAWTFPRKMDDTTIMDFINKKK